MWISKSNLFYPRYRLPIFNTLLQFNVLCMYIVSKNLVIDGIVAYTVGICRTLTVSRYVHESSIWYMYIVQCTCVERTYCVTTNSVSVVAVLWWVAGGTAAPGSHEMMNVSSSVDIVCNNSCYFDVHRWTRRPFSTTLGVYVICASQKNLWIQRNLDAVQSDTVKLCHDSLPRPWRYINHLLTYVRFSAMAPCNWPCLATGIYHEKIC